MSAPFLFSVDLEDVRKHIPDGESYSERLPENTERLLEFLDARGIHCTFFTVGDVARSYPELVGRIAGAGHEIASHTSEHWPLERHNPESFREDLERCREDFARAGVDEVVGFRAPMGSLTRETSWAFDVLSELGYTYSSSVLAAQNPLYGWPDFGPDRPCRRSDLWELPSSLTHLPLLNVPFVGGVYFRVLPFPLIRHLFRKRIAAGEPVLGYLHPYDIDSDQERFMHPYINGNRLYNWLLYRNRAEVFTRLDSLLDEGAPVVTYRHYVEHTLEGNRA